MGRLRSGFGHLRFLDGRESPFNFPRIARVCVAARWLLIKIFSMTTALFVFLGAWMLLSLIFCLALCVVASKRVPEFEPAEEPLEFSECAGDEEQAGCANGYNSLAPLAKRP